MERLTRGVGTLALVIVAISVTRCQISCPERMYPAWAGDWCCNSKCGPGTRIVHSCSEDDRDDTMCEPCGLDYFNPYADQLHCRRKDLCEDHYEEIKVPGNATVDNECQCQTGYYRVGTLCLHGPVCPPGKGATRSGHCEVCLHGTFSNISSRTQPCLPWQRCPLGYIVGRPGTNVSDVVCTSHPLDWLFTNTPDVVIIENIKNNTQGHRENGQGGLPSSTIIPMAVGICVAVAMVIGIVLLIRRHQQQQQQRDKKGDTEMPSTSEIDGLLQPPKPDGAGRPSEQTVQLENHVDVHNKGVVTFTKLPVEASDDLNSNTAYTIPKLVPEASAPDPNTIPVNNDTTDYIEQHLGDDYLDFARALPVPEGCEFAKTDLDELKHTYKIYGPREAIRETLEMWKSKQGDRARLGGLLQGLTTCGRDDMVEELCKVNNVH